MLRAGNWRIRAGEGRSHGLRSKSILASLATLLALGALFGFSSVSNFQSRDLATRSELPPPAPPPRPPVLPAPAVRVLSNGLKVVVIERHSLPLLTLRLMVMAGAEADPQDLPGTAQMAAALMDEGTSRRSALQIAESVDSVGGTIDTGADWDSSFVALSVLTDHTDFAFDLLSDIVIRPAFAASEVERKRKQTLSALEVVHDDPAYLADAALRRIIFAGTPYGHPADGTLSALRKVTAQDLRGFYVRNYRPSNGILAVVGEISSVEAFSLAEKFFGAWEGAPAPPPPAGVVTVRGPRQVIVIDKPDAVQTEIRVGNLGVRRDSPDYYALTVANQILGGPATNRLFKTLRSQQGLTYGASSDLTCYQTVGSWVVKTSTRTSETLKSLRLIQEEVKHFYDRPISGQELETAQRYLTGHLALEFESSDGIAEHVLELMVHNLPLDYWNRFPERIDSLTSDDVWRSTRRYLDPDREVVVLVGNAAGFSRELKKLGPVRVIPRESLDLASANLERATGAFGHP